MFIGETNKFTPVTFLYYRDGFTIAEGIWHEKKEDYNAICLRWVGKEDDSNNTAAVLRWDGTQMVVEVVSG